MSKEQAAKAVSIVLACYPSGNRDGIEAFHRMAVEALACYPSSILEELVQPRTGIMRQCKFLPSIAELVDFCDRQHQKQWRDNERDMNRSAISGPPEGPLTPEQKAERERVKAGFKKLMADLSAAQLMRGGQYV